MSKITAGLLRRRGQDGKAQGILYCPNCGSEYSASPSDYFSMGDDEEFKCCGLNNLLVEKKTHYRKLT